MCAFIKNYFSISSSIHSIAKKIMCCKPSVHSRLLCSLGKVLISLASELFYSPRVPDMLSSGPSCETQLLENFKRMTTCFTPEPGMNFLAPGKLLSHQKRHTATGMSFSMEANKRLLTHHHTSLEHQFLPNTVVPQKSIGIRSRSLFNF